MMIGKKGNIRKLHRYWNISKNGLCWTPNNDLQMMLLQTELILQRKKSCAKIVRVSSVMSNITVCKHPELSMIPIIHHDRWLLSSINMYKPCSTIFSQSYHHYYHQYYHRYYHHYQPWSTIVNHYQPLWTIVDYYKPWSTGINPLSTVMNHDEPLSTGMKP